MARKWCETFGHRRVTPEGRYGFWRCITCDAEGELPAEGRPTVR